MDHPIDGKSNARKYSLLFQHVSSPCTLPTKLSHGCYRKFNTAWLDKYPWLRYSRIRDGLFCGACFLLLPKDKQKDKVARELTIFELGQDQWCLSTHSNHSYHVLQSADVLKSSIENPASRIDVMVSSALQSRIAENKHIVRQIVRAVIFLAKQGWHFEAMWKIFVLRRILVIFWPCWAMLDETDRVLHNHLYLGLGTKSQNEIINIIGYDVICAGIIAEVQKTFYSIMTNEVSCHHVEHFPLCLCFVDEKCEILIRFLKLERVRAVDITDATISSLEGMGLSLNELRGQGYDGASTTSGEVRSSKTDSKETKALYTHCAGHSKSWPNIYTLLKLFVHFPWANALANVRHLLLGDWTTI